MTTEGRQHSSGILLTPSAGFAKRLPISLGVERADPFKLPASFFLSWHRVPHTVALHHIGSTNDLSYSSPRRNGHDLDLLPTKWLKRKQQYDLTRLEQSNQTPQSNSSTHEELATITWVDMKGQVFGLRPWSKRRLPPSSGSFHTKE